MNRFLKYSCLLIALLFGGCAEWFDNEVPTYTVVKNAIYDATSAENALRGIYSYLAPGTSSGHDFDSRNDEKDLQSLNVKNSDSDCISHWEMASKIVNAANLVIEGVNALETGVLEQQKKEETLGEARFMRAWAQLYLMKYYAWFWDIDSEYGPLMRRTQTTLKNMMLARSTVNDISVCPFNIDTAIK